VGALISLKRKKSLVQSQYRAPLLSCDNYRSARSRGLNRGYPSHRGPCGLDTGYHLDGAARRRACRFESCRGHTLTSADVIPRKICTTSGLRSNHSFGPRLLFP